MNQTPSESLPVEAERPCRQDSKIGNLPLPLQEWVNQQIFNGIQYKTIIAHLEEQGHPGLNPTNLCAWKKTAYRIWLDRKNRKTELEAEREYAFNFVREREGRLHDAAIILAANQLTRLIARFDTHCLETQLLKDPTLYLKLVKGLFTLIKANKASSKISPINLKIKDATSSDQPADPNQSTQPQQEEGGASEATMRQIVQTFGLVP